MTFTTTLAKFADWRDKHRPSIKRVTVEVTEIYARRVLSTPKGKALKYRGLALDCVGSKVWRQRNHSFPASKRNQR